MAVYQKEKILQKFYRAIKELEPDSESELARIIDTVIYWAERKLKGLETKRVRNEESSKKINNTDA